jgi:hypothetical protein
LGELLSRHHETVREKLPLKTEYFINSNPVNIL